MKSTQLKIIDDIAGDTKIIEVARSRGEIIDQLVFIARDVRLAQKAIRLCLHITKETITVHFWAEDTGFAKILVGVGSIPHRTLEMIQTGEENWV